MTPCSVLPSPRQGVIGSVKLLEGGIAVLFGFVIDGMPSLGPKRIEASKYILRSNLGTAVGYNIM